MANLTGKGVEPGDMAAALDLCRIPAPDGNSLRICGRTYPERLSNADPHGCSRDGDAGVVRDCVIPVMALLLFLVDSQVQSHVPSRTGGTTWCRKMFVASAWSNPFMGKRTKPASSEAFPKAFRRILPPANGCWPSNRPSCRMPAESWPPELAQRPLLPAAIRNGRAWYWNCIHKRLMA